MPLKYVEENNLGAPWRGFTTRMSDARLPDYMASVAQEVDLFFDGLLRPERGWDPLNHRLAGSSGHAVEGMWVFDEFGDIPTLIYYANAALYNITGPAIRTANSPVPTVQTNNSEGLASSMKVYRNILTNVRDPLVTIPPDGATFGRRFFLVNGWNVNHAFDGVSWRRMGIQRPNSISLNNGLGTGRSAILTNFISVPGPPAAPQPLSTWRIYCTYFDQNSGVESDPGDPFFQRGSWAQLFGGGSPLVGGTYDAQGSRNLAVTHVRFYRTTRNGTQAYFVGQSANVVGGVVTSPLDILDDDTLRSGQRLSFRRRQPRIAKYIQTHKGRVFLAGGLEVDLTDTTVSVTLNSDVVTFVLGPSSVFELNDSMVGAQIRVNGSERTYTIREVGQPTVLGALLTVDYGEATGTLSFLMEGFDDLLSWSESLLPEAHPLDNAVEVKGDNPREGLSGPITGLGEYDDALIIFKRRAVWLLHYSSDPSPAAGGRLRRVPGLAGCVAHRSIVRIGPHLFFLGEDAVWVFDGQQTQSISRPITDFLLALQPESLARAWAIHDRRNKRYLLAVRQGADHDWPDTLLSYWYEKNEWTLDPYFTRISTLNQGNEQIGSGTVMEEPTTGEELSIVAVTDFVGAVAWGRGVVAGAVQSDGFSFEGIAEAGSNPFQIVQTTICPFPTNPNMGLSAFVEMVTGPSAGILTPISDNNATTLTANFPAGVNPGDQYRIGARKPVYRVLAIQPKAISTGKQIWFVTVLFNVFDADDTGGCVTPASVLILRLYVNGVLFTDWRANDQLTGEGWQVFLDNGRIEIDMGFLRRAASGQTRSVVRIPVALSDLTSSADVVHMEFSGERANNDWELIAAGVDQNVLPGGE